MRTKEQDIAQVKSLHHGKSCTVAWSEGGGGEVYLIWDTLFLFEIPQYGGQGNFEMAYDTDQIEKLVDEARSWT